MSFVLQSCGDNFHLGWNTRAAKPKSGYTAAKGDLCIADTTVANGVDLIAADENPAYIVDSTNNANGTLTVTRLVAGVTIELPYSGSVALGDKIEGGGGAHGTSLDRSTVRTDNSNGVGRVIAVDADAPHGTGHCVVEF
jgi:hypothetical protein